MSQHGDGKPNDTGTIDCTAAAAQNDTGYIAATENHETSVDAALDEMRGLAAESGGVDRDSQTPDDGGAGSINGAGLQEDEGRENAGETLARSALEMLERAGEGNILEADGSASGDQKDAFVSSAGKVFAKHAGEALPYEDEITLVLTGLVVLAAPVKKLLDRLRGEEIIDDE
jgi:hypothetical protein